jgi:hypothetical protein
MLIGKLTATGHFFQRGAVGDNQFDIQGTWPADGSDAQNQWVVIYMGQTGSGQGIIDVASQNQVSYLDFGAGAPFQHNAGANFTHTPDADFSDAFQASTTGSTDAGYRDISATDTSVAVQPFVWCCNAACTALGGINNITPQLIANMGGLGKITKSYFSGVATDVGAAKTIYLTGRDDGSGTRIVTMLEMGYGIGAIQQYQGGTLTGVVKADGTEDRAANTVDHKFHTHPWPGGSAPGVGGGPAGTGTWSGWNSGGWVNADLSDGGNLEAAIGYLSIADAKVLPQLTYNGTSFSKANVENGAYTIWGYEHFYDKGTLAGVPANIKASIIFGLDDPATGYESINAGAAGINLNVMNVARGSDGGLVQ